MNQNKEAFIPNVTLVYITNEHGDRTPIHVFKRFDPEHIVLHCDPIARFKDNETRFALARCVVNIVNVQALHDALFVIEMETRDDAQWSLRDVNEYANDILQGKHSTEQHALTRRIYAAMRKFRSRRT